MITLVVSLLTGAASGVSGAAGNRPGTDPTPTPTPTDAGVDSGSTITEGSNQAPSNRAGQAAAGVGGIAQPAPLMPASTGTYFGGYLPPAVWTVDGQKQAVQDVESYLGRRIDISNHYFPWEKPLPTWREAWDLSEGRIPMISWDGTSTSLILDGSQDAVIDAAADGIKALNGTVFLRFFWEMDGYKKADVVESPSKFIAAWRYIHDRFAARGVTNVVWVWCPNAWAFTAGTASRYYPGDAYVDWVAADGYNWGTIGHSKKWTSLHSVFKSFYAWGAAKGKPMMIAETASVEQGGDKASWIAQAASDLQSKLPKIRAFVWFDSIDGPYDWRIDTTQSAYGAFRTVARTPFFNPLHP